MPGPHAPSAISPDGRLVACASHNGRVRVFPCDAGSGSSRGGVSLSDDAHLGRAVTAIGWVGVALDKRNKINGRDASQPPVGDGSGLVVVGDALGAIALWRASTGALHVRADAVHAGPVRSVDALPHGSAVVSCGGSARGVLVVTRLGRGTATADAAVDVGVDAHTVRAHPGDSGLVLVGGTSIVLWDIAAGCARARFAGHAGRVVALAFSPAGGSFASAGESDRFVSVWDLPAITAAAAVEKKSSAGGKNKGKPSAAAAAATPAKGSSKNKGDKKRGKAKNDDDDDDDDEQVVVAAASGKTPKKSKTPSKTPSHKTPSKPPKVPEAKKSSKKKTPAPESSRPTRRSSRRSTVASDEDDGGAPMDMDDEASEGDSGSDSDSDSDSASSSSSAASSSSSSSASSSEGGAVQVTDATRSLVAKDHPFALSFGDDLLIAVGRQVLCAFPAEAPASTGATDAFAKPEDPMALFKLPVGLAAELGPDTPGVSSKKKRKSSAAKAHAADPGAHDAFLAAAAVGAGRVLAVRGNDARPVPFAVDAHDAAHEGPVVVLEPLQQNASLADAGDGATAPRPRVAAAQSGPGVEVVGRVDQAPARAEAVRSAVSASASGGASSIEPTFEERLRELGIADDKHRTDTRDRATKPRAMGGDGAAGAAPKADSLLPVLEQAVSSSDASLLEYCLSVADRRVIDNTVASLRGSLVVPFTASVVDRFRSKPSRGMALAHWVRALLRHHTPSLVASRELVAQLQGLYQSIEERVRTHREMMRLGGRLDVLMVQIEGRRSASSAAGGGPVAVFRDDEDEDLDDDLDDDDDDEDLDDDLDDVSDDESDEGAFSDDEDLDIASGGESSEAGRSSSSIGMEES